MGSVEDQELKEEYSSEEVSQSLNLSLEEIQKFQNEGVFDFLDDQHQKLDHKNFLRLKSAVSLYRELGVNLAGIDIILSMKEKMSHLQTEFNDLLVQVQKKLGNQIQKDMSEISKNLKKDS
ncbi:MAG: hypothetical protein EA369_05410 [Bradymonadales bacterium]|nr:MAG: hypothetical protein EA369_05410 [Bradymonadales bacterium]